MVRYQCLGALHTPQGGKMIASRMLQHSVQPIAAGSMKLVRSEALQDTSCY